MDIELFIISIRAYAAVGDFKEAHRHIGRVPLDVLPSLLTDDHPIVRKMARRRLEQLHPNSS